MSWRKRRAIALIARDEVLFLLLLFLVNWLLGESIAAIAAKQLVAVWGMKVRLELSRGHFDTEQAKTSRKDAGRVFEVGDGLGRQNSACATSWRERAVGMMELSCRARGTQAVAKHLDH